MDFNDIKKEIEEKAPLKVELHNKTDNNIITKSVEDVHKKEGKELPKITPEMLPSELSKWVRDVCERIESPFEIGVVNALTLIGNLIGNRVAIKPKEKDFNFMIYPNLWGLIIGKPSIKKTPVFKEISKSIDRIQAEESKKFKEDSKNYLKEMEFYSIKKDEFLKKFKNAKEDNKPVFTMEVPEPPTRKVHITEDATIEAIAKIIKDNPKGLLVLRDEISGFLKTLDSSGKEEYRGFFLQGWSSGSKNIDRVGSGHLYIPKLTLGILGNIQPSILKPYIYETVKGKKADGLLQRFQLLVYAEPLEIKGVDRTPNKLARDDFDSVIKYIVEAEEFEGAETNDYNKQPFYSYSKEAQEQYTKWYIKISEEARNSENEALESHLAKYANLINALALIFHICELSKGYDRNGDYRISLDNFNKALNITNVLKEHAKKLYSTLEVEEQHKEDLYYKIENKIIELNNTSKLPLTFGKISQLVANANAKNVEEVAKDIAIIKGKKVIKLQNS